MNPIIFLRALAPSLFTMLLALCLLAMALPAWSVSPEYTRICPTNAAGEPINQEPVNGTLPPGVGQLLPGRYYTPRRSGQGWDFFWYGNTLEAGASASNDKLFVTFYTYEWRGSGWVPAWYGATFDPAAQPSVPGITYAGLGFYSQLVGGVPVRTQWNGILHRYDQVTFAGGYGPIREANPGTGTPSAEVVGKVTLYFGADGISNGQRPDQSAVKWQLTNQTLHPGVPNTLIEDCLQNALTGNQNGVSDNAAYVGVWADANAAAGWFWTPIFWKYTDPNTNVTTENEHHALAFFDQADATSQRSNPSWIIAGTNASVCFVNDHPEQPYPPAPAAPYKSQCAMRPQGYAPWHTLCDYGGWPCSHWNSENNQFRVGKLTRGAWTSTPSTSTSPTPINRTELSVDLEAGQRNPNNSVPLDTSELSVARAPVTGNPYSPFNSTTVVSQLTGFTRIRIDDVVTFEDTVSADPQTCKVALSGTGRGPGLCDLRVHFMTEGAHPNMVIVRRRDTGASAPPDIHVLTSNQMRSPMLGQPYPANALAPQHGEALIIGDKFRFQAFVDEATARQFPAQPPLFETLTYTAIKADNQSCFLGNQDLLYVPVLQVLPATASGQVFNVSAAHQGGRPIYGVRLRIYQALTNGRLIAERLVNLNLTQTALNQDITVPLPASQSYTAKAEIFNHCKVLASNGVALNPPTVTLVQPAGNVSVVIGNALALSMQATDDGSINASTAMFRITQGATTQNLNATHAGSNAYTANWTPSAVGTYTLIAQAADNLGMIGQSIGRTITVTAPVAVPDDERAPALYTSPAQTAYIAPSAIQASAEGGSAQVAVPIRVPPGRHGMQPSVGLSYSSRGGNGVAGLGWSLSGTSSIHRCPKTFAQDGVNQVVQFDASDRLCMDGQRLIATQGSYGQTLTYYKTEVDNYALIQQVDGTLDTANAAFIVQGKDGRIRYYGRPGPTTPTAARNSKVNPSSSVSSDPLRTLTWLLEEERDRVGNTIVYTYSVYGSGEHLLTQINYTGQGSALGNRLVTLSYEDRSTYINRTETKDWSSSYLSHRLIQQTQRLRQIESNDGSIWAHRYTLRYGVSNYSKRTLLQGVTECAREGAAAKCLPEFAFTQWNAGQGPNFAFNALPEPAVPARGDPVAPELPPATAWSSTELETLRQTLVASLTSNNRSLDQQAQSSTGLMGLSYALESLDAMIAAQGLNLIEGRLRYSNGLLNPLTGGFEPFYIAEDADFDGDGSREIRYVVRNTDGTFSVYLISYSANRMLKWIVRESTLGQLGGGSQVRRLGNPNQTLDLNNDGRADMLFCYLLPSTTGVGRCDATPGHGLFVIYWEGEPLSTPTGNVLPNFRKVNIAPYPASVLTDTEYRFATAEHRDVNGDGRTDLLYERQENLGGPNSNYPDYRYTFFAALAIVPPAGSTTAGTDFGFRPPVQLAQFDTNRYASFEDFDGDGTPWIFRSMRSQHSGA